MNLRAVLNARNALLEAQMRDPLVPSRQRVEAWIERYSWGELSLFAIGDGRPKYQVHCARELGLNTKSVSVAVSWLQRRGYLEPHAKLLIPSVRPAVALVAKAAGREEETHDGGA